MMTPPTDKENEQFVGIAQRFANQQRLFAARYALDSPPLAQVRTKHYIHERRDMLEWRAVSITSGPTSRVSWVWPRSTRSTPAPISMLSAAGMPRSPVKTSIICSPSSLKTPVVEPVNRLRLIPWVLFRLSQASPVGSSIRN